MSQARWRNGRDEVIEPQELDVVDLPIVAVGAIRGVLQALINGLNSFDYVLRAWANHRRDQHEFNSDVRSTIGRI